LSNPFRNFRCHDQAFEYATFAVQSFQAPDSSKTMAFLQIARRYKVRWRTVRGRLDRAFRLGQFVCDFESTFVRVWGSRVCRRQERWDLQRVPSACSVEASIYQL